jgi:hypothetical protein
MPPARKGGTREGGCGRLERGGDLGEKGLSSVVIGEGTIDLIDRAKVAGVVGTRGGDDDHSEGVWIHGC